MATDPKLVNLGDAVIFSNPAGTTPQAAIVCRVFNTPDNQVGLFYFGTPYPYMGSSYDKVPYDSSGAAETWRWPEELPQGASATDLKPSLPAPAPENGAPKK